MPAKASRAAFGEALLELGAKDERIVTLDADLSKSTMTIGFAKQYPQRAFNLGIAESNMIGVGAGLALTGRIPFACSFACFIVGRFETIRISVAYTNANLKIVGTHSGIAIGEDGYSQMGLEDVACIRSLPNIGIIQPADELETKQAIAYAVEHQGPLYLRLTRQNLEPVCPPDYRFQYGRWLVLRRGHDVTLIGTGEPPRSDPARLSPVGARPGLRGNQSGSLFSPPGALFRAVDEPLLAGVHVVPAERERARRPGRRRPPSRARCGVAGLRHRLHRRGQARLRQRRGARPERLQEVGAAPPAEAPALGAARGVLPRAHRVPAVPRPGAWRHGSGAGARPSAGGGRHDEALRRTEPESG